MTPHGRQSDRDGSGFADRLYDAAAENPVAAALVGMGLVWLFASGSSSESPGASTAVPPAASTIADKGKRAAEAVVDASGSVASRTREAAAELASTAGEKVSEMAGSAHRRQIAPMQRDIADFFERQPLAVGAVGLAIGAAIGSVFRTTTAEAEALGSASQSAVQKGQELVSRGLDAASEGAANRGATSSRESAGEAIESGAQKLGAVAGKTLDALQESFRGRRKKDEG
jgi:hypothetical protein